MTPDLNAQALDLALAGAPPTGDTELDAAVARATADIAAIRAGLALIAAELPMRGVGRPLVRPSRRRRVARFGFVVAVIVAAVVGLVAVRDGAAPGSRSSSPSPHFTTDTFGYRPGAIGSGAAFPFRGYSLPELSDISASSARDVWIVGSVAWHWDGNRWRAVPLPTVSGVWSLSSVVAIRPDDAWAVGSYSGPMQEIVGTHPLIEHWNGARWSVIPLPFPGAAAFNAVSAEAPNDVWAVGWWVPKGTNRHESDAAMRPLVAHWDGQNWHITTLSAPKSDLLKDVVALSPSDVWVAGPGLYSTGTPIVRHWDGSRWASIRAPFGPHDPNFTLTATSATDAWAVGGQKVGSHIETIAAHWDGHTWMIAPAPTQNTDSVLVDVQAISPTDVWALGQSNFTKVTHNPPNCKTPCTEVQSSFPVAIYEHWNGQRWSLAPVSSERMMFEGSASIAAAPDGAVWAAGSCYWQNVVTHWNGHTWQPVPHPPDITWDPTTPQRDRNPPATSCLSKSPR